MAERSTETEITFKHAFILSCLVRPLAAGTYRVTTDEEEIEGLSFSAYRRTATLLHIPSIEASSNTRQHIQVNRAELDAAHLKDAETSEANLQLQREELRGPDGNHFL
jgi:hypothetical protein